MASLLDRAYQLLLLRRLEESFPHNVQTDLLQGVTAAPDWRKLLVNLAYLREHGIVETAFHGHGDDHRLPDFARINAKGVDFLADDGGLSAVLGVVTVKLHSETIRELLIDRVRGSNEPHTVKEQVIAQLKATPAQALGQLTERALDAGLRNLPQLGQLLQGWMV